MAHVEPTLTLRDIAELAGVQRAVVSMWRRRPRVHGQDHPFPRPAATDGAIERFRRDEIVDWLERTGRGNRTEHRLDAPATSTPVGATLEDLVTLLCLQAHCDGDLADLSADERAELAARVDPDDRFLLTEVEQLTPTTEMLRFVDDLVEASYGLPDALARLENGPAGRALARRELTAEAISVIGAVIRAGVRHLDPEGVPIGFAGGAASLALAVGADSPCLVVPGDGPDERGLRRRADLSGIDVAENADGPQMRVLVVLGLDEDEVLNQIDQLVLELEPDQVGVIVGAAGVLCDGLTAGAEQFRAKTLRVRRLVGAMRLPRGMWRHAYRQALGLWVCAGARDVDRPLVADLGAVTPEELSADDLATDVFAAFSGTRGRQYRYLRPVALSTILSGAPIVPMGARTPRLNSASTTHLDRAQSAALVVAQPAPLLDVLLVAAPGAVVLKQRSLGELRDDKLVRIVRGSRIDASHAVPEGTVAVLTADSDALAVALDRLDAERFYPRAARTEAGDVLFLEGTPPRARVDELGGALVASPSRILRLRQNAGIGPHTLAAIVNHQTSTRDWRTWAVPILTADATSALETVLAEATAYGAVLRQKQAAVHDLITALIDGVAAGAVSVVPSSEVQEGH